MSNEALAELIRNTTFVAPSRIAATFRQGSMHGKWTYVLEGNATYESPGWKERYTLDHVVWHSEEDRVMSYLVYLLSPVLFRKEGVH